MHEMTEEWAVKIQKSGYGTVLASILEGLKPVGFIGAQFAYLLNPFVGGRDSLNDLGEVLEDPDQLRDLMEILRGGRKS